MADEKQEKPKEDPEVPKPADDRLKYKERKLQVDPDKTGIVAR